MTSFGDILKKAFLNTSLDLTIYDILYSLGFALVLGLIIIFIYKASYRGVVYSRNFNISLLLMTLITTAIILTIRSNVILSLGMVGALSIVRYRTAIKDPMDLVFLFWSVGTGVAIGAQIYMVGILSTVFIAVVLLISSIFKDKKDVYLLVINYQEDAYPDIRRIIGRMKTTLKTKTVTKLGTELTLELKVRNVNGSFVNELSNIEGVSSAVLVAYNGDFAE